MVTISVSVPARLHLGFLDINGSLGRKFGSLGVSLSAPLTRFTLKTQPETTVTGPEADRATRYLRTICKALGVNSHFGLDIAEAIPAHAGLGSGTQLALGIGSAVRQLSGIPADSRSDAIHLERGARSGAGIGLFDTGGVVLDAGRTQDGGPPPVIARHPFPDFWRIILVMDRRLKGIHGEAEREAFARLPPFPECETGQICRTVVIKALPALIERDISAFGIAIADMQRRLGDYFAPAQGGHYTSASVARIAGLLERAGAHGCGQSSWGPTGFAFAESEERAEELARAVRTAADSEGLEIMVVKGNNSGATCTRCEE